MGFIRALARGFDNRTNAYFVALQAVVVLTLAWITFVLAGTLLIGGIPDPLAHMFQFPFERWAWLWFAGGGVLLGLYGIFLVYLLRKAANRE